MTVYDQGELYYLKLTLLEKLLGDCTGHRFVVEIINQAIDDKVFERIVCQHFSQYEIDIIARGFKITGQMNAEEMTDGENDFSDEKKFLEKMSQALLDKFKALPGWGKIGGPDMTIWYSLHE